MVDVEIVCCMCGDVGFTDKLFRCNKCRHRYQHSYCSNFYGELLTAEIQECDWCRTESGKNTTTTVVSSSKKPAVTVTINRGCSSSSSGADKIIKCSEKRKSPSVPSPRRRYKLLKDVMC